MIGSLFCCHRAVCTVLRDVFPLVVVDNITVSFCCSAETNEERLQISTHGLQCAAAEISVVYVGGQWPGSFLCHFHFCNRCFSALPAVSDYRTACGFRVSSRAVLSLSMQLVL